MKISELGSRVTIVPAPGDVSVTIADLAMLVEFDPGDASRYSTSVAAIAYEALEDEYGAFEKDAGEVDYSGVTWMRFKDGSTLRISSRPLDS